MTSQDTVNEMVKLLRGQCEERGIQSKHWSDIEFMALTMLRANNDSLIQAIDIGGWNKVRAKILSLSDQIEQYTEKNKPTTV